MFPDLKFCLFILIIFHTKPSPFALGRCSIRLNENVSLRPKVSLTVGSRQVDVKLNKDDEVFTIFEHAKIQLECYTKFAYPPYVSDKKKIEVRCTGNHCLYINDSGCYSDEMFECSPEKWNLYESLPHFVWCPQNTSSYILARPLDEEGSNFQYLAGVCYDTLNLSFASLYFTISFQGHQGLPPAELNSLYKPVLQVEHTKEIFRSKNVVVTDYSHPEIHNWIEFAKYNYSSIIQNELVLKEFDNQFGSLLDLVWWPNLRLGNWKRYESALKSWIESEKKTINIIAGVSAVAAAPIRAKCENQFTLTDLVDNRNGKIPLYVWHYLRSTSSSSDEIVIIGVNSPFYEFYSEDDIVFCQDKCKEVAFLEKVSPAFRYSALGVIFCCSSEDVKQSQRLEGFPDFNINTQPDVSDTTTANRMFGE